MKLVISSILIALFVALTSCSDVSPNAVELTLDYTWEGFSPCLPGTNPEIRVSGIPEDTKYLVVSMSHSGFSDGEQKIAYEGSGIITKDSLDKIDGPCDLPIGTNRFKYKVEAFNEKGDIIGVGSKARDYPDKK